MNRSLFKAAAVLNIAVASLIYVACSGDDGKDGKDGCRVARNATTGLFDITCDGSLVVSLDTSGSVAGPPGESCSITPKPYGADITCGATTAPIYNGEGGVGGGGECSVTMADAPPPATGQTLNGDRVIQIRCVDGRAASVLVCPQVPVTSPNGATGLLFNVDGQLGRCTAAGLIARTEQKTRNCGGVLFDAKKEFCQRTLIANSSATASDAGFFATLNKTTGIASSAAYPNTFADIDDPESAYNLAGENANVRSLVLPLCGVEPATSGSTNSEILAKHVIGTLGGANIATLSVKPTVYNALQHCGRNLIFKTGIAAAGNASETWNGKTIPGGQLDKDGGYPFSAAWSVQEIGSCYAGLAETNDNSADGAAQGLYGAGINGFTFSSTGNFASLSGGCASFFAVQSTTVPPYSTCPPEKSLFGLDDVGCKDRSECTYHSTVDNTCLVGTTQLGSLFGKDAVDSAFAVLVSVSATDTVFSASWTSEGDPVRGIYRTKLGSRYGRGGTTASPIVILQRNGNIWSRPCQTTTASRAGFYAINDPYLTNKRWKTQTLLAINAGSITVNDSIRVEPPICGGKTLIEKPDSTVTAVPFDDAFSCIKGQLSFYYPATQLTNDGSSFDKPLYCVQESTTGGIVTPDQYCFVSGSAINSGNCGRISTLTAGQNSITISSTVPASWQRGECRVGLPNSTSLQSDCANITAATLPRSTPIVLVAGAHTTSNPSTIATDATRGGLALTAAGKNCTVPIMADSTVTAGVIIPGITLEQRISGENSGTSSCESITAIRQVGTGIEVAVRGILVDTNDDDVNDACQIETVSGASLANVCLSVELLRSTALSGTQTVDASGEFRTQN